MFGLVDCNNFFVSCERIFRPDLNNKPVIVLSNNDGCAVARSNEVKALGIPMGAPFFKIKDLIRQHNIQVFSSNFSLYGDMSSRVMQVLSEIVPRIEVYSIDEAFFDCRGIHNLDAFAHKVCATLLQSTGLPASIGIAPTKTLAKIANYFAKKRPELGGVCVLQTEEEINRALAAINVADIWGIGRQISKSLNSYGIYTGLDLKQVTPQWMRTVFTVVGERLVRELQGLSCLNLDDMQTAPKSIQVTRSFGRPITDFDKLREAVSFYASRAGERLRKSNKKVKTLLVFARTSHFKADNYHSTSATMTLPYAVDDDASLIKACGKALEQIFKPGGAYKKAGVMLIELIPKEAHQYDMFDKSDPIDVLEKKEHLSKTLDRLNKRFGKKSVSYGACGLTPAWRDTKTNVSPAYTTRWDHLREVC